jgi:hypothetical protein
LHLLIDLVEALGLERIVGYYWVKEAEREVEFVVHQIESVLGMVTEDFDLLHSVELGGKADL